MVFRSHRPIFGRMDHGTLSRIHSSDLSRSEEWDAQKGPNQREISMKPNALRWHFDQPSLHLRPHGVQRFLARPSLSISMNDQWYLCTAQRTAAAWPRSAKRSRTI